MGSLKRRRRGRRRLVWGGVPVGVLLLLLLLILAVGTQNRCVMSQKLKKDASQVGGVSELVEFCPTLPTIYYASDLQLALLKRVRLETSAH